MHPQVSAPRTWPPEKGPEKSYPAVEAFDLYFLRQLVCFTHAADKERDI